MSTTLTYKITLGSRLFLCNTIHWQLRNENDSSHFQKYISIRYEVKIYLPCQLYCINYTFIPLDIFKLLVIV
jgi:hypothetical protein